MNIKNIIDTIFNSEETTPKSMLQSFHKLVEVLTDYVEENAIEGPVGPEGPQGQIGPEGPEGPFGTRLPLDNGKIPVGDLSDITNNLSNTFFVDTDYAEGGTEKIGVFYGTQHIVDVEVATFIKIYIVEQHNYIVITNLGNITERVYEPEEPGYIRFGGPGDVVVTAVKSN